MSEFMSLRDFLLLRDPIYENEIRELHTTHASAAYWVKRYDFAKASYEKYGDEGPPVGTTVCTLVPGHGGNCGLARIFGGVYERDPREFFLIRKEGEQERHSLVCRAVWWSDIAVIDPSDTKTWRMIRRMY